MSAASIDKVRRAMGDERLEHLRMNFGCGHSLDVTSRPKQLLATPVATNSPARPSEKGVMRVVSGSGGPLTKVTKPTRRARPVSRSVDNFAPIRETPQPEHTNQPSFMNSRLVKGTLKELRKLPWYNDSDRCVALSRFTDSVMEAGQTLATDDGDARRRRRGDGETSTSQFLSRVREFRSFELINALRNNLLDRTLVPEDSAIRSEYPAYFEGVICQALPEEPPQPPTDERMALSRGLGKLSKSIGELMSRPSTAKPANPVPSVAVPNRSKRANVILNSRRGSEPICCPVVARKATPEKAPRQDVKSLYWKMTDPLGKDRQGEFRNPLEAMDEVVNGPKKGRLTSSASHADIFAMPLLEGTPSLLVPGQEKPIPQQQSCPGSLLLDMSALPPSILSAEQEVEPEASPLQSEEPQKTREEVEAAVKSFAATNDGWDGNDVSKELEDVWEKLGFSVTQKLQMMVRYTSDASQSAKLSEALQAWKSALKSVQAYDQAYKHLKEWLRYDAGEETDGERRSRTFKVLGNDWTFGEKRVKEQIDILNRRYGDTLIYRQKIASEWLQKRRTRIQTLWAKYQ